MHSELLDVVLLMLFAVVAVWLFKRINLPPILAYLCCGIFAGPELFNLYESPHEMHLVAELGIVFLLFSLGLEFSLPKMLAMRHLVFGVGLGQMVITTLVFMGMAYALGLATTPAFVIGSMMALSSTAIVIKQSAEMGILNTNRTQIAVSILLLQDLAVVPLLIIIPLLAASSEQSLVIAILIAVLKGSFVFVLLLSMGKWVLPRIFSEVARTRTDELFMLTTVLVALIAAGMTYSFGLSMALGAFLAGMMLGESQYRHQLEADIRPFRDILMGLFFISVGMQLDLSVLIEQWYTVLLGLVVVMAVKIVIIRLSAWLFNASGKDALAAGFKLCQMGEFSFVIAALAANHGIITQQQASLLLSIGILSMAVTPWLVVNSDVLARKIIRPDRSERAEVAPDEIDCRDHVLIFGFGRVGQTVSRLLKIEGISYLVVDNDPIRVNESRLAGENIVFGEASHKHILRAVHIDQAKLVILTFDHLAFALDVIEKVRALHPSIPIVVRTRKDYDLEALSKAGATLVVPEILEGSLMLVSQVMHLFGVPMERINERLHSVRSDNYQNMHGFFPGETTEINYENRNKLAFLHAVVISPKAYASGKKIADLQLHKLRVSVVGLRRNNVEFAEPEDSTVLNASDVLIISGKPRLVERAEMRLLEGKI